MLTGEDRVKGTNAGRVIAFLTEPRFRRVHAAIIAAALLVHLALHYATYVPSLREPLGDLPYFRLHMLHEAEFLLIVAYSGITFGWKGGLITLAVTAVTSVPFILTPYIFGREPEPNEIRDLAIQVAFILLMGYLIVALYMTDTKRRQLATVAEALREADEVKSNFISMASHELRTPLTMIQGFSELLARPGVDEEKRREWAEWVHRQSQRLTGILDDFLNVSRMQAGKLSLRREAVAIPDVTDEAIRALGILPNQVSIGQGFPERLPPAMGDRDKVVQVLVNLLSNAVKYSPQGGRITVSARHEAMGPGIVVSVSDQGIGISPEDQGQLFRTFHRIQREETEQVAGSGLGLYIVKSLVDLMGGEVWVDSRKNAGSTFSFSLPVQHERASAPEPQREASPSREAGDFSRGPATRSQSDGSGVRNPIRDP